MTLKEIKSLIATYHIKFRDDNAISIPMNYVEIAKKDNMLDVIKSNKPLILSYFQQKRDQETKAFHAREAKIREIEGLDEIMQCNAAWAKWHRAFDRMMDTGSSKMNVPCPSTDEKELRDKYPRANAYLIALAESQKTNYELSSIGEKALNRIINGEDYTQVLDDMNDEIKSFVDQHIWD